MFCFNILNRHFVRKDVELAMERVNFRLFVFFFVSFCQNICVFVSKLPSFSLRKMTWQNKIHLEFRENWSSKCSRLNLWDIFQDCEHCSLNEYNILNRQNVFLNENINCIGICRMKTKSSETHQNETLGEILVEWNAKGMLKRMLGYTRMKTCVWFSKKVYIIID